MSNKESKHLTVRGLVRFYQELLNEGKITVGGPAHQRLKHFQGIRINILKRKLQIQININPDL